MRISTKRTRREAIANAATGAAVFGLSALVGSVEIVPAVDGPKPEPRPYPNIGEIVPATDIPGSLLGNL